jgi:GAF domain-containing protein
VQPPVADYGLQSATPTRVLSDERITSVTPYSAAARADIRRGDVVSFGSTPLQRAEARYAPPGARVTVRVNGNRTAELRALVPTFQTVLLIPLVIRLAFLAVAALLAWRRPDNSAARALVVFLICFGLLIGLGNTLMPTPMLSLVVLQLGSTVLALIGAAAATNFAAKFPSGVARPVPQTLARAASVLAAVGVALGIAGVYLAISAVTIAIVLDAVPWIFAVIVALLVTTLVVSYFQSGPSERQRRRWIFLLLGAGLVAVLIDLGVQFTAGYSPFVDNAALLFIGSLPFGLAYVILRHRVIDVGFVINQAVVYAAVSAIVVGIFVIVETLASTFIQQHSRAGSIALQLAVALILGFSIRYIHARVDGTVDRLLFRQRHLDDAAIAEFTHDAHYITAAGVLLERCVATAIRHGHAVEAGVWLRAGSGRYDPNRSTFAHGASVDENDPALVAMRARRIVADLHALGSTLPGALAFPMIVRGELLGALVCGNKEHAEAYAPDEIEALRSMASAVAHALDAVRIRELEERVRALEAASQSVAPA